MPHFVYVLALRDGCVYVGSTTDVERRFAEHVGGVGAEWTKLHLPEHVVWSVQVPDETHAVVEEARRTAELMLIMGPNRVRGAGYSRLVVDPVEVARFVAHTLRKDYVEVERRFACFGVVVRLNASPSGAAARARGGATDSSTVSWRWQLLVRLRREELVPTRRTTTPPFFAQSAHLPLQSPAVKFPHKEVARVLLPVSAEGAAMLGIGSATATQRPTSAGTS